MTKEVREAYRHEGFTESQIEEIEKGLDQGIDVSVYANKDLMSQQMYQIRIGLAEQIDMRPYADPKYDWFQMEEIREGLLLGLEVKRYDNPEIPSEKMHEMRRGLEDGMDLSDFLKFGADIMFELRHALRDHIDIISYVEQGYDAGQLKEIRHALAKEVDIYQYLLPEFRAVSIHEIVEGIEANIDVELYAKPCYTWAQMRELKLGLLSQVDISYYQSPLYDRYQMEQIRLGLEEGLEVDEYTSLMYPAPEMERVRLELQSRGSYEFNDEIPVEGEENKDGLMVSISSDDMTAYIRMNREFFGKTTRKDILRTLRHVGVTKNVDPRMLDNLLSGKHLGEVVQIATGKPPIDGADGYYEFFFDTDKKRAPKILPDGSADFQNMNWYEQVKKDQKIAYYHAAGKGEEGFTVTGNRIPPKRGKELKTLRGSGFVVLPDKKTYIASFDGKVDLEDYKLTVSKMLMIPEVNSATGNVEFDGNVLVTGEVSNGAVITAGGDVIIDGFVSNCTIVAGGDVIIKKGVNGGGAGNIAAKGAVEGKFFESVNVRAGKSIKVNYCLHSNIYSEDSISILGGKGLILGGTVFAANDIKVANIGNESGVRTVVKMGVSDSMKKEQIKVDNALMDLKNKMIILEKGQKDFQDKYSAEIRNSMDMYIKIENAIFTLKKEEAELVEKKEKIMRQVMATAEAMMTVTNNLYENVLVDIDGKKILTTRANNVTIKRIDNRVGIFKNN